MTKREKRVRVINKERERNQQEKEREIERAGTIESGRMDEERVTDRADMQE